MTVASREFSSHLVPRVTHLDAQSLEEEILDVLKGTLLNSVQFVGVGLYTKWEPELDALLKLILYRFSLIKNNASVGQALLNIKYPQSTPKRKLVSYSVCLVLFSWIQKRITDIIKFVSDDNAVSGYRFVSDVGMIYSVCNITNLLLFLHQGFYSTLSERFFNLRPVSTVPPHSRQITYSYFRRELLWHGFAELIAVVIPLIPIKQFNNFVISLLPKHKVESVALQSKQELSLMTSCTVCGNQPIIPHHFGCCHYACYYCLLEKFSQQPNWCCPLCDHVLENKVQISPVYPGDITLNK